MVKQGILITPVLGEVLTNLAPLRMKHSAMPETLACFASLVRRYALCSCLRTIKANQHGFLYIFSHVPSHIRLTHAVQGRKFSCIGFRELLRSYLYQFQMLSKPDDPPPVMTESGIQCLDHMPAAYLPRMVLTEIPGGNESCQ